MGLLDGFFDPDQFQDSGGLIGRLSSLPQGLGLLSEPPVSQASLDAASASTAGSAFDPTQNAGSGNLMAPLPADSNVSQALPSFDLGAHLNAGFQKWTQTPVGNPFAALANGIAGFNTVQPSVEPAPSPARPAPAQTQDFSNIPNATFENPPVEQNANPPIAQNMMGNPPSGIARVGYFETPANPNAAFAELWGIQASREKDTITGQDFASGVREGTIKRNEDGSLDVTDGTVVTFSFKNDSARITTVTGSDIAHIDKTGNVVLQKAL